MTLLQINSELSELREKIAICNATIEGGKRTFSGSKEELDKKYRQIEGAKIALQVLQDEAKKLINKKKKLGGYDL